MNSSRFVIVLATCAFFGCSRAEESEEAAAALPPPAPAPTAVVPNAAKGGCPATGQWALCSLETRLRRSGFVAHRVEGPAAKRSGFTVEPVAYTIGSGRLEIFLYEDSTAMKRDIGALDTLTVSPPGEPSQWPSQPGLIRSANVAAVYLDQSPRQAERLMLAITAGPPSQ